MVNGMKTSDIRKWKMGIKARRGCLFALVFLFAVMGISVYAKYYTQSSKYGVAIASGVYFTANHATSVQANNNQYFESVVSLGYIGGDYNFDFEVRNYENNLLFNESAVVIPYSVSFWLEDTPTDANYYVSYDGEEQRKLTAGKENAVTYSLHSIAGGAALANKYNITIDALTDADHIPVPIYVEVITEPGAVIDRVLRGKMVLNSTVRNASYIESQEFIVPDEYANDAEKFLQIQKMSEFTYEIRTVGAISDDESMTEKLKLMWDPEILEIDQYDASYLKWKEETGNTAPLRTAEGMNYIILDVMPYSASVVYFFRGENFEEVTNMATLNAAVLAEKYQDSTGNGE